ncbi:MAG: hypothetical protein HY903_08345 [Deltaproteobacteria bacterium]|nr:hypothetical protein [Deltaproteobacteria bacterium]
MNRIKALVILVAAAATVSVIGCGSTGACVGSGGVLSSPECKEDWSEAECDDWGAQGVNGAAWTYHGGDSCSDLGYTSQCSDGSFRLPGNC